MFSAPSAPERLRVEVSVISMADYEALHYDKEKLKDACKFVLFYFVNIDCEVLCQIQTHVLYHKLKLQSTRRLHYDFYNKILLPIPDPPMESDTK